MQPVDHHPRPMEKEEEKAEFLVGRVSLSIGWSSGDQRDGQSASMESMIHRIIGVCLDFPLARRLLSLRDTNAFKNREFWFREASNLQRCLTDGDRNRMIQKLAIATCLIMTLSVQADAFGRRRCGSGCSPCGIGGSLCATRGNASEPVYVEKTIMVPTYVEESRTVKQTVYETETRIKTVTVKKCVPVQEERTRTYTVMVPEKKTKTINYTARKPVWMAVSKKYTVRVPVWSNKDVTYTVMVPTKEQRQGTRAVSKRLPVTKTQTVKRDKGGYETHVVEVSTGCGGRCCGRRERCCGSCGGCGSVGTRTVERKVWVPNIVEEEIEYTVYQCVTEKVPYTYAVWVCKPEERTKTVRVCNYENQTRFKTYTVCNYVTAQRSRDVTYTVCAPKEKTETYTVTVYKTETEEKEVEYKVSVPKTVEQEIKVTVCKMVPKTITVPASPRHPSRRGHLGCCATTQANQ
jgi:hypothetical protein